MKDLLAVERNLSIIPMLGKLMPLIELIFITREKSHGFENDAITELTVVDTIRIQTPKLGLRALIESLQGYEKELNAFCDSMSHAKSNVACDYCTKGKTDCRSQWCSSFEGI